MSSTFTKSLRLVMQGVGDNSTTWGTVFNQQFAALIDAAIAGYTNVPITDANYTLTATNGTVDQSRPMILQVTGTLTAARTITLPSVSKLGYLFNATTGGFSLTLTTALAGATISVPNGGSVCYGCDGTNIFFPFSELGSATTNTFPVGYLNLPQNSQSSNYTLVATDAGKHLYHPASDGSTRVWTIPANASVPFIVGTTVTFANDIGGTIQIGINSDTLTLAGSGSTGTRQLSVTGVATALKVTATSWLISGAGLS